MCLGTTSVTSKWVQKAKSRYESNCATQTSAYQQFLKEYQKNEQSGGKREKKRTHSRRLKSDDWDRSDLPEKRLLVIGENGIGDEVLTAGCIPQLMQRCKQIVWQCSPKLQRPFSRSFPQVVFLTETDGQSAVDGVVYSWELVRRFRTDLRDFGWLGNGDFTPYLQAPQELRDDLRQRYTDGTKTLVGLTWRSERDGNTVSNKTCDVRDVPYWTGFFEALQKKVRFVSLQYGDTQTEIDFVRWKYGVEIYQDRQINVFEDIDAAAAQIAAMDYVVSISTATAHLAGALGIPGWVMLPDDAFPHWRVGKDICPWYPTLRPVPQVSTGDWGHVLETVTKELGEEIGISCR